MADVCNVMNQCYDDLSVLVEESIQLPTYVLYKEIPKHSAKTVWEALSNPQLLKEMHPLIVEVQVLSSIEETDGTLKAVMDVTDKLKFLWGLIHSKTTYRAYMRRPAPTGTGATRTIYFRTTTMGTAVSTRFECEPLSPAAVAGGRECVGTRVCQTTCITAPFGLKTYVTHTARVAHEGSLDKLPSLLDTLPVSDSSRK
jgi:hypothetical protein